MEKNTYWIMVVDDDIPNLKIAGSILSKNGMRVTAMNNGRALIDRVRSAGRPDLILLDILMPGMDGFETLTELRSSESETSEKPIPVIFLTADDNKETREKALSLGAAGIIHKPFDPDMLIQRTEKILYSGEAPLQPSEKESSSGLLRQELKRQFDPFTEQTDDSGAFITDSDGFGSISRFITRYIARYGGNAQKVLISISADDISENELQIAVSGFENRIVLLLRKSDVILRSSPNTYLLLLPMMSDDELSGVMERIIRAWNMDYGKGRLIMSFVSESIGAEPEKRPEINGLDWRYAKMNLPNDKILTDTVKEFTESMPGRLDRLEKDCSQLGSDDALNTYRIEVHSMKSAAATIGLLPLSGMARMLEDYARNARISDIKALHPLFSEAWYQTYTDICNSLGFNIRDRNKDTAAKVPPALLDVLKTGIENMDTEAVSGALTKIMSYDYDSQTEETLQKLKKAAIEFDDSAFDIIKELLR